jgi:hypothetical protein
VNDVGSLVNKPGLGARILRTDEVRRGLDGLPVATPRAAIGPARSPGDDATLARAQVPLAVPAPVRRNVVGVVDVVRDALEAVGQCVAVNGPIELARQKNGVTGRGEERVKG